jgi:hypothetical protein
VQHPYLPPFVSIVRRDLTRYYYPTHASVKRLQVALYRLVLNEKAWIIYPWLGESVGWMAERTEAPQ